MTWYCYYNNIRTLSEEQRSGICPINISGKDVWSTGKTVMLIQMYERYKFVWNPKYNLHCNKYKRNDAFIAIATEVRTNIEYTKKKVDPLISQYRQ